MNWLLLLMLLNIYHLLIITKPFVMNSSMFLLLVIVVIMESLEWVNRHGLYIKLIVFNVVDIYLHSFFYRNLHSYSSGFIPVDSLLLVTDNSLDFTCIKTICLQLSVAKSAIISPI